MFCDRSVLIKCKKFCSCLPKLELQDPYNPTPSNDEKDYILVVTQLRSRDGVTTDLFVHTPTKTCVWQISQLCNL